MIRLLALLLAYLFVALAIVGVFLPGLPTVPFLLLAALFSAKGSERLHRWLYAHPRFGSILINWEQQGAVSRKSKIMAILMLCGSWTLLFHYMENRWLLSGITGIFLVVSIFITTRPEPH